MFGSNGWRVDMPFIFSRLFLYLDNLNDNEIEIKINFNKNKILLISEISIDF